MDSEQWLAKKLAPRGITMVSLPPSRVAESLIVDNDRVLVNTGKGFRKLDYLYLDRLTEVIPPELLQKIIGVSRDGRLRIDPPPSYLFNEKVPLALPFTDEYRRGFSGRIREILIPSALMHDGKPDLSAVASSLDHPGSSVLSEMNQWEDLLKVPRPCGSSSYSSAPRRIKQTTTEVTASGGCGGRHPSRERSSMRFCPA